MVSMKGEFLWEKKITITLTLNYYFKTVNHSTKFKLNNMLYIMFFNSFQLVCKKMSYLSREFGGAPLLDRLTPTCGRYLLCKGHLAPRALVTSPPLWAQG